jgi:RNA polymerase primary sigma factor
MPLEDLFHEGVIGLIRAARRFDSRRGKPFASYAGFWIRKYIREALSREICFLHVPSHRRFGIGRIAPPRCAPAGELQTGATPRRLDELARRRADDAWNGCFTLSPEDCLLRRERVEIVRQAVEGLSSIERSIIADRFGLDNDRPQTLDRIGLAKGLTRQRVHQIEEMAKRRLRRRFKMLGWAS